MLCSFGGHLQKKKRQSFEVPAHLKLCLTSEWSETLGVRSLRGANLTPHNSTLSLSYHRCYCCCERRRRRGRQRRAEAVGPSSLSGRESRAGRTPHLLLQPNWSRYLRTPGSRPTPPKNGKVLLSTPSIGHCNTHGGPVVGGVTMRLEAQATHL